VGVFFDTKNLLYSFVKFFATILALYVFTASVLPCADASMVIFSSHGSYATVQQDTSRNDDCSTFCICNCCGVVFEVPAATHIPNSPFVYKHRSVQIASFPLSNDFSSIWQPPKTA